MGQNRGQQTSNYTHGDVHVPEALLIDFDTELDSNNSGNSSSIGDNMDLTSAAVENVGDLLSFSAREDEEGSVFESAGSSNTLNTASPVIERPQFSEYTDLDVLLSRLEGQNRNGADYDVRTICPTTPQAALL